MFRNAKADSEILLKNPCKICLFQATVKFLITPTFFNNMDFHFSLYFPAKVKKKKECNVKKASPLQERLLLFLSKYFKDLQKKALPALIKVQQLQEPPKARNWASFCK